MKFKYYKSKTLLFLLSVCAITICTITIFVTSQSKDLQMKDLQMILYSFWQDPFNGLKLYRSHKSAESEFSSSLEQKLISKTPEWFLQQISDDFSRISKTPLTKDKYDTLEEFIIRNQIDEICRVKILNNKFYYKFYNTPSFRIGIFLSAFVKLSEHAKFPNMDFFINVGDNTLFEVKDNMAPIFTIDLNKHNTKNLILIPDPLTLSSFRDQFDIITEINKSISWDHKISKAFWRGSTTGSLYKKDDYLNTYTITFTKDNYLEYPRVQLVEYSHQYPELLDAEFVFFNQQVDKRAMEIFRAKYKEHSFGTIKDQLGYKIQINVDGNSITAPGLLTRLLSNSVTLKQESDDVQWFYRLLKPMVNYIPIKYDMSDVIEKIIWVKEHDNEARIIAENANSLVQENLTMSDIYWYIYIVLKEYSKLIDLNVEIDSSYKQVK